MRSATTSTRGVITSRTSMSRSAVRACWISCSWDSPPSLRAGGGAPRSVRRANHGKRRRGRPGGGGWVFWAPPRAMRSTSGRARRGGKGRAAPDQDRDRLVRLVGEALAGEERRRGTPEPEGVEGLYHPPLGTRAAGEEDVGPPVEEHQHRHVPDGPVGLAQAQ